MDVEYRNQEYLLFHDIVFYKFSFKDIAPHGVGSTGINPALRLPAS